MSTSHLPALRIESLSIDIFKEMIARINIKDNAKERINIRIAEGYPMARPLAAP